VTQPPSIHRNNFDRVADIYDATRGFTPEVEAEIGDNLAAILRRHGGQPSVIEVGVGTGRIAVPLAARGIRVTGIDISVQMLQKLRAKRGDIDVLLAEASSPPFRPASFDAAIFVHILHLVPDPHATLRATVGCLRPGAVLLNCHHTVGRFAADRAGERMTEIIREVTGTNGRVQGRHYRTDTVFNEVMDQCGATLETTSIASWTETTTARIEIAKLANRTNSNTWAIPDDAMPEILRRFAPEAEAIYGGLDLPAEAPVSFSVTVATLPG
jgi:ubiquinone/menaquinone biosynthesis C-methylase UbiE